MTKLINTSNLDKLAKGLNNRAEDLVDIEKGRAMAVEGALQTSIDNTLAMFDGRGFKYVTQAEYDSLSQEQKDREDIVWCITDAEDFDMSAYQTIEDDSLETTVKTIPGAINEISVKLTSSLNTLNGNIGELGNLSTTVKSNIVSAINELYTYAGDMAVAIGDKSELTTNTNANLVNAINELNGKVNELTLSVERVASSEVVQVNVSNGVLNLTTDRYQKTTMVSGTSIQFPTVTGVAEIHLFFDAITNMDISFPDNCKWRVDPNLEEGNSYELIATYNGSIWLVNLLVYS